MFISVSKIQQKGDLEWRFARDCSEESTWFCLAVPCVALAALGLMSVQSLTRKRWATVEKYGRLSYGRYRKG